MRLMGAARRVCIFVQSVIAVFGCPVLRQLALVLVLVMAVKWGEGGTHELSIELGQPGLAVVIEDKHSVDHRGYFS